MISREEVLHIAKLARLELSEQELEKMQKDLSGILDYFDLLKKVDTSKIKLEKEILPIKKTVREDKVIPQKSEVNDNLINSAPDKKDDYIKVKAVL